MANKKRGCWRWPTLAWGNPRLPSALVGLTSGFEMGPGVPPPLLSPTNSLLLTKVQLRAALRVWHACASPQTLSLHLRCAELSSPTPSHSKRRLAHSKLNRIVRSLHRPACCACALAPPHTQLPAPHTHLTQSTMMLECLSPRALVRFRLRPLSPYTYRLSSW